MVTLVSAVELLSSVKQILGGTGSGSCCVVSLIEV